MTDILLIQPPIRDFYLTTKRTIPYGLACIASALIERGFSVEILDCLATSKSRVVALPDEMAYLNEYYGKPDVSPFSLFHHFRHFGYGFQRIGEAVGRSGAFLVGISSLFTAYSEEALRAAEAARASNPRCTVVMGGHHPTEMPEEVMRCKAVDYVLRGEGEVSMPALAKALKDGRSVQTIPGIVYRKADGGIAPGGSGRSPELEGDRNPYGIVVTRPAVMDRIDAHPLPALHLLSHRFYRRGTRGSAVITASRGCPMQCTYCSVGGSPHIPYRRRSVEAVLREMDNAVIGYGAGFIDFEDENISMDRQWFLELLRAVKERYREYGLELRAMNGLFPPSLDDELIRAMKEAGFKALNLSLGTTSPEQLRRFRRPSVREAFDEALYHAEMHGLGAVGYIIAGAPEQNALESVSDLLFLARRRVLAGVSVYYPSPGSTDYMRCLKAGILPEKLSLMRSTAIPISHTTTREESITLLRLSRILNFMKSLLDKGETLPQPSELELEHSEGIKDRAEAGRILLQSFLHDGVIRGLTPDGKVFEHKTSQKLSRPFIEGLTEIRGHLSAP